MSTKVRINEQIRAGELRVIDGEGTNRGLLSLTEALRLAKIGRAHV